MAERGPGTLARNIYFFRGSVESAGVTSKLVPQDITQAIDGLHKARDIYFDVGEQRDLCAWNQSNDSHAMIAFGVTPEIRRAEIARLGRTSC